MFFGFNALFAPESHPVMVLAYEQGCSTSWSLPQYTTGETKPGPYARPRASHAEECRDPRG
jgi:hypothetical protein